jgi:N-methylhydantoinase A/oxoprolinase/acetone carboxylase beta subunit
MTIGSGPTNSMRGAAFLTGFSDAIVMDVGGTTTDIGVLANGFPRESSVAADIGGVRTNFRMPDILAMGLGGGTRIHLDPSLYGGSELTESVRIGPDSVGHRIAEDSFLFGGSTLTTSDVAAAAGAAHFGDSSLLPPLSDSIVHGLMARIRQMFEDGVDRMKTSRANVPIIVVGGGSFLVPERIRGADSVIRPDHAAVANAVGAAIAQVGAQIEQVVDYARTPRETVLETMRALVAQRCIDAGGDATTLEVVEVDEVFLSYLPGHAAQVRIKAVSNLAQADPVELSTPTARSSHHAH